VGDECDNLLEDIDHLLHGELPADRTAALHAHLDECPPCFESADFQAQLKGLIARRCGEQVPEGFEERLLGFLRDEQPS
jgi:anti-sigma factor (TIGR02949 family)